MNPIECLSINHHCAPVQVRECIAVHPAELRACMREGSELYSLNTCNRAEVYWVGIPEEAIIERICVSSGLDSQALQGCLQRFSGQAAVEHLFGVAAGLESLVLGEAQILGQVKEAFREAVGVKTTGVYLGKALHRCFRAAKRVRTETGIGNYPVSVASEAVELAGHIFEDLSKSRALIIGAGDMAAIAARRLKDNGVRELIILNRTYAHACALACELDGAPRPFEALKEELIQAQIVITSTGAREPIITRELMAEVMKRRRGEPVIIIDIAVPRDVSPEAGKLYNCYLYDIDALKAIVERHYAKRLHAVEEARAIIRHEAEVYEHWLQALSAQHTIKDLYSLMDIYAHDQARAAGLSGAEAERLEQAVAAALKRFLHRPVSFLKEHPGITHIDYARRLFRLDEDYTDRHKG